jgi:hypothetical protein
MSGSEQGVGERLTQRSIPGREPDGFAQLSYLVGGRHDTG